MNGWLWGASLLLLGVFPCLGVMARARVMERLVALQGAQVLVVFILLLLAEGYHRDIYVDMALVLAVLNLAAGLVFVRFLERWL